MIAGAREFFRTPAGKGVAVGLVCIGLAACVWSIISNLHDDASALSRDRVFICSETGKPFNIELTPGTKIPAPSPYSGKNTGYPAEPCYWTKDGKPKEEPTWVLLNTFAKKPEPTFCPDCGRLVRPLNPPPQPGQRPPPTQEEMKNRRGGGGGQE